MVAKKFFAMVALLLMLCLCVTALAAQPRYPTGNTTVFIRNEFTGPNNPDYIMQIPTIPAQAVVTETEKIYNFVTQGNQPVVRYFSEDIQDKITELFPETVSIDSVLMFELIPLDSQGFKAEQELTYAWFDFATVYVSGQHIAAVAMVFDAQGSITYIPLPAFVTDEGVQVSFTPEALALMEGEVLGMAILHDSQPGPVPSPMPPIPSKTTGDMTIIVKIMTEVPNPLFEMYVQSPPGDAATAEVEKIYQFVTAENQSAARYFEDGVLEDVVGLLPDGLPLDHLEMNEFVPIGMRNFSEVQGGTVVWVQFATDYQDEQVAVAVTMIFGLDGQATAVPLEAVVENGIIRIAFPIEVLEMMVTNELALAILSSPQ
jgi:hypothetical protein